MQPAIRRAFFVSRFPEQPFRVGTSLPMLPFGGGLRKKMATDSTVAIRVHLLFFLTQLCRIFTHSRTDYYVFFTAFYNCYQLCGLSTRTLPARLNGNRHDGDPCYRYCGSRGHRRCCRRPSR